MKHYFDFNRKNGDYDGIDICEGSQRYLSDICSNNEVAKLKCQRIYATANDNNILRINNSLTGVNTIKNLRKLTTAGSKVAGADGISSEGVAAVGVGAIVAESNSDDGMNGDSRSIDGICGDICGVKNESIGTLNGLTDIALGVGANSGIEGLFSYNYQSQ